MADPQALLWMLIWLAVGWSLGVFTVRKFDARQLRRWWLARRRPTVIDGIVIRKDREIDHG